MKESAGKAVLSCRGGDVASDISVNFVLIAGGREPELGVLDGPLGTGLRLATAGRDERPCACTWSGDVLRRKPPPDRKPWATGCLPAVLAVSWSGEGCDGMKVITRSTGTRTSRRSMWPRCGARPSRKHLVEFVESAPAANPAGQEVGPHRLVDVRMPREVQDVRRRKGGLRREDDRRGDHPQLTPRRPQKVARRDGCDTEVQDTVREDGRARAQPRGDRRPQGPPPGRSTRPGCTVSLSTIAPREERRRNSRTPSG